LKYPFYFYDIIKKPINMFNKYKWIEEQVASLSELAENGGNYDDLQQRLHEDIDSDCIYYAKCFAIIAELGMTDWSDNEFGPITNIQQLAFAALYEFANEEINIDEILESVEQ
jgi:hypothetical protein